MLGAKVVIWPKAKPVDLSHFALFMLFSYFLRPKQRILRLFSGFCVPIHATGYKLASKIFFRYSHEITWIKIARMCQNILKICPIKIRTMKLLKILLYIALGIVALILALGIFGKKEYHIERSIEIDAPKSTIYDYVRMFKNYEEWSPWTALDPNQKTSLSGTDGEVGAKHTWNGNNNVGEGSQTITALKPDRIETLVKFMRPFESESPTFMAFAEKGGKTNVTWGFDMKAPFPMNGLMIFTDVDKAMGKDYEMGLSNLKRVTEELARKQAEMARDTVAPAVPVSK
jgi:hypothetical protein